MSAPLRSALLVAAWLLPTAGRSGLVSPEPPGPAEASSPIRRVCVQMGVPTFSAPDRRARIARSRTGPPARLGGGEYVALTGARQGGFQQVETLERASLWVPATDPASGRDALCPPATTVMRACRRDGADVPVRERFDQPAEPPITSLRAGSLVRVFEYFEDRGRWAFVEAGGKAGFARTEDLCLEATAPPGPRATDEFGMTVVPAGPECFQSHRERGASEIRRIVVHNSESSIASAAATFRECDAARPTSAHVGIDREGRMFRFVEDRFAAFHTGASHGGFNAVSLGVELEASEGRRSMTVRQERALVALVSYWATLYRIALPEPILGNSTRTKGYHDREYWEAPVTIHRLVSATRGTDCPTFVWADSPEGDEAFFRWRERALGALGRPPGGGDPAR